MKTIANHPISHVKDSNGRTFNDDGQYEDWLNAVKPFIGLTKREYFAAMAMQGLLAADYTIGIVTEAVQYADDLIKALNKE